MISNKERFFDAIDRGREGKNLGLSIGLPKLELYIDGYLPETYYLIGGNSGTGKSTYMIYTFIYKPLQDFLNGSLPERDPYWIYFNLEMTAEQVYSKLVSMYIYENFGEQISFKEMFSRGKDCILSENRYNLIKQCNDFLSVLDERIIFYEGTLNAEKYKKFVIENLLKFGTFNGEVYIPGNPDRVIGVIVDHMSLLRASSGHNKKEEMDLLSSYAVQLRNRCKISPIHIMQFNRDASNQERTKQGLQEPTYADFKDSGTMIEDSHIVIGLHSPVKFKLSSYGKGSNKYNVKELGNILLVAVLLKSRFGTSDIIDAMGFYGNIGIFKELPRPDQIIDYTRYKTPDWTLIEDTEEENQSNMRFTL